MLIQPQTKPRAYRFHHRKLIVLTNRSYSSKYGDFAAQRHGYNRKDEDGGWSLNPNKLAKFDEQQKNDD